jgi:hypothetical protein
MFPLEKKAPSLDVDKTLQVTQWLQQPTADVPEPPSEILYEPQAPQQPLDNDTGNGIEEEDVDSSFYRDVVLKCPSYSWLLANLRREATLTRGSPDSLKHIEDGIIASLPPIERISKKVSSPTYKAIATLDWDLLGFLEEQQYPDSPYEAVRNVITITGCASDAQALTSAQYLSQTWPTTGKHIMNLLSQILFDNRNHHSVCKYLTFTFTNHKKFLARGLDRNHSLEAELILERKAKKQDIRYFVFGKLELSNSLVLVRESHKPR